MSNHLLHLRLLIKRLWLLLIVCMLLRIVFFIHNRGSFPGINASTILHILVGGIRFDITTIIYLNVLFVFLHLVPFPVRDRKTYQKVLYILFLIFNIPAILIALIDTAYFPFNNKRITSDIFGVAGAGMRNAFNFIAEFWFLAVLLIILIYILKKRYARMPDAAKPIHYNHFIQTLIFLLAIPLLIIGARGGLQQIPITPANATDYVEVQFAPLVTNSAYTLLYSLQRPGVEEYHFFSPEQTAAILQVKKTFPGDTSTVKHNVVLIILESMAKEYVGYLNNGKGYTPFLDSLFQQSLVFPNGFANAERSNKSMCVILGGLPSLTDDAFMNTIYSVNCFKGLGSQLKSLGYYTSFFHGGINGEFKFDSFTKAAGFDHYYGKNEFNDNSQFDGNWGIYDDVFFQFIAKKIAVQPQPFCTAMFSLSSHDPFNIPNHLRGKFPKGYSNIIESIGYTDYSLRLFFNAISKKPWFKNTLFVITADHTFGFGAHPGIYNNSAGKYSVPIAFFLPNSSMKGVDSTLAQHLDILPSILNFIGYKGDIKSYGNSLFQERRQRFAIQLSNSIYQVEDDQYILFFDGKNSLGLYNFKKDHQLKNNLKDIFPEQKTVMENYCKAFLQNYHHALIHNTLCKD